MNKFLKLIIIALLSFGMMACGEKKLTEDDLKQAEASLFNEDMTANMEAVPVAVEKFCTFAEQNLDVATAPDWLFKALQISVSQKDVEKSVEICDKMMKVYPDYDKTPAGMFLLASFIYEDQLRDLDKARAMYESILANYPENELVPSVEASLRNLGKTPEELIKEFEMMQAEAEAESVDE